MRAFLWASTWIRRLPRRMCWRPSWCAGRPQGLELLEPAFEDEQATVSGSDATKRDEMHRSHVNDDVEERASLLDRISSEMNKLNFYQNQGKDLARFETWRVELNIASSS